MDAASFKERFLPCHQKLYRVAFRMMGNAQDAEDLVQEAYLKLWNKRNELTEIDNTEAYCVTLIKNLCYDVLRANRIEEDRRQPEELSKESEISLVKQIELRDEAEQVYKLIHVLPEQQRKVMLLRDVRECSFEEIERITGLNTINIRVLLSRARKRIREQFNYIRSYENR